MSGPRATSGPWRVDIRPTRPKQKPPKVWYNSGLFSVAHTSTFSCETVCKEEPKVGRKVGQKACLSQISNSCTGPYQRSSWHSPDPLEGGEVKRFSIYVQCARCLWRLDVFAPGQFSATAQRRKRKCPSPQYRRLVDATTNRFVSQMSTHQQWDTAATVRDTNDNNTDAVWYDQWPQPIHLRPTLL